MKNIVYFDLETQMLQEEVGGWENAKDMRVSIGVAYDSGSKSYYEFDESRIPQFLDLLWNASLVVGFNIEGFDYKVLSRYCSTDFSVLPTWDIVSMINPYLKRRVSMNNLAKTTLGLKKSGDGVKAVELYRAGELDKLIEYCKQDVDIVRQLFRHGCSDKSLEYIDKHGQVFSIDTSDWTHRVRTILNMPVDKHTPEYDLLDYSTEKENQPND